MCVTPCIKGNNQPLRELSHLSSMEGDKDPAETLGVLQVRDSSPQLRGSNKHPIDVGLGCIMWLPENYHPRQGSTLREPPGGALNHPVLVLGVSVIGPEDAIISYAILRSFTKERQNNSYNSVDLSKHGYQGQYVKILRFVPEKKKTVQSPPPLTLEHRHERKFQLQETSFVNLGVVYNAHLADLRVYNPTWGPRASSLRLSEESFNYVWERIRGAACGVGAGAAWTWVPTAQLKSDFAKCARVRDDALKASATAAATLRSGIKRIILLLIRLSRTIDSIFAAPSSQLGESPHHLLLHCVGLAAALATFGESTTTREGTNAITSPHALTYGLYAIAIAMISRRRLGLGAQRSPSVDLFCAEFMGDAALLAGIVYAGFVAKQSAEPWGSPAQPATMSMTAGISGPGDPDEEGWTRVTNSRRRR